MKNKKMIITLISILILMVIIIIVILNKNNKKEYVYATLENDYQVLKLNTLNNIVVLNNTLVKLTIKDDCNIVIDEFNINKNITDTDNVVEFTPNKEGEYKMIINNKTYYIKVVNDKSLFKVYDPNVCSKDAC